MKKKLLAILPKLEKALEADDMARVGALIGYMFGLISGVSLSKEDNE